MDSYREHDRLITLSTCLLFFKSSDDLIVSDTLGKPCVGKHARRGILGPPFTCLQG